jgi:hypothetical protein
MEKQHALLSASSAGRWTKCPASARLEELFVNEDTEYSKEGTIAHSFAEKIINGGFDVLADITFPNSEMEQAVLDYVGYVNNLFNDVKAICKFAVKEHEVKLDFSEYVLDGFGTADTVIIADGSVHVIDFKYGKGVPVDAFENTQLMLYGIGAYLKYDMLYDIEKIELHIVQPRLNSFTSYQVLVDDLLKFGEEIKVKADIAYSGNGDAIPGDHCQFCRARHICKARANHFESLVKVGQEFKLMTDEEILAIYPLLDTTEKFIKDVKQYMLDEAIKGKKWPGLKLVEGRSNRQYSDEIAVVETLKQAGYQEAEFTTRKVFGITEMTKFLGKKNFENLLEKEGLIVKPVGKPTLAPITDKRPEFNTQNEILNEFEDLEAKEVN